MITDNFDGKGYGRPNDLVVSTKGGVYFTEPGPNAPPPGTPRAGDAAAAAGGVLRGAGRQGDEESPTASSGRTASC